MKAAAAESGYDDTAATGGSEILADVEDPNTGTERRPGPLAWHSKLPRRAGAGGSAAL